MLYWLAFGIKVLLFWGYKSTDFEVHRNWMAITYNLPLKDWYYESTSQWTLDYPPFFAYFEYFLSNIANLVDPAMLVLSETPYTSDNLTGYMRITVLFSELLLVYALYLYSDPVISAMVLLNPGLIYVDCKKIIRYSLSVQWNANWTYNPVNSLYKQRKNTCWVRDLLWFTAIQTYLPVLCKVYLGPRIFFLYP